MYIFLIQTNYFAILIFVLCTFIFLILWKKLYLVKYFVKKETINSTPHPPPPNFLTEEEIHLKFSNKILNRKLFWNRVLISTPTALILYCLLVINYIKHIYLHSLTSKKFHTKMFHPFSLISYLYKKKNQLIFNV